MRLKFGHFGASTWARGFLRSCRRSALPLVSDWKTVDRGIRARAQQMFDERVANLPDKQGRVILAQCSLVLAAYQELKQRLGDPQAAFETVRQAFAQTFPFPMVLLYRLWLWWHRDPVAALQRMSMAKVGQRMYGSSMGFGQEQTANSADMLITRCAYHKFFESQGAPELTVLVCAWDRAWMEAIDRSARPVRIERLSTISTGGDCCRFSFVRDEEKAGKKSPDVVLVQLQARGTASQVGKAPA